MIVHTCETAWISQDFSVFILLFQLISCHMLTKNT